ncbi:hypothetical protein [Gordonia sp. 852002-51296_SCH5728562-b]|uniref:hypothetical protein n=1 Tax=Gordonia sp. 852002-51296_SCH5728562-b TaxID=1834101 RepID=UPI0007E9AC0A|nr:hypothetical protein [Gordonia sp. 852002-51296_SCH5728562-b]OBA43986.1 hypothetical protein A5766_00090 [Gordonia sp. 852002-51296_SCH5728562-b]
MDRNYDPDFDALVRNVAGTSQTPARYLADEVEAIANELGVTYAVRDYFVGRDGREARADIIVGDPASPAVVVAVAGFDAPGWTLTYAQQEITTMARVHLPTTAALVVIDGAGWARRPGELRRVHRLHADGHIDGLYTGSSLDQFRDQLRQVS